MTALPGGARLERLRAEHADALLAFERINRAFFARWVPDRGDAYFAEFPARHAALLAEQDTGRGHFHVLVEPDGAVAGRVNLIDVAGGVAELGYRIAQRAGGRGLATAGVLEVCRRAAVDHGLTGLWAGTAPSNVASGRVLRRAGFVPAPPRGDRDELRFIRSLSAR